MATLEENIDKVVSAHAALKTAIAAKGVTVPDGAKLSDMPALVSQVETPPVPTNPRAVFANDTATSIVVPKVMVVDFLKSGDVTYCFSNCDNLTSLTLPDGFGQAATNVSYCFIYCNKLTSLTLPDGFGSAATNVTYCFSNCNKLTSLTLPDGFGQAATNVSYCFIYCRKLTSLTLPDGFGSAATNVAYCFYYCNNLTSLTLPDGFGQAATNVAYCFSNCNKLTSLTLPDGFGQAATSVAYCFSSCSALTDITGNPNFKTSLSLSASPNLTHDSLMVVINGLQTVATAQTLTLGATNLAKLTNEEKKVATDKGWTLA